MRLSCWILRFRSWQLARTAIQHSAALGIEPPYFGHESSHGRPGGTRSLLWNPTVRIDYTDRKAADEELTSASIGARLDLLCLTYDKIIPAPLIEHYEGKIFNVHPALLPAFRGMNAVRQALCARPCFSGVTIHEVDKEVDHGSIICQGVEPILESDTEEALACRLYNLMRPMYLPVISWYREGRVLRNSGGIRIQGARYGSLPISPAIERAFP
jgi:phosphoribosylglycinamide formyltransferase-1